MKNQKDQEDQLARSDKIISVFVLLAFLITSLNWFSNRYITDDYAWLIYDLSLIARISLLPLLAFILVENRILRNGFRLYFILTLSNFISVIGNYESWIGVWFMQIQIICAGLIILYVLWGLWKQYKMK